MSIIKTLVIYHNQDADGFMSAAIVKFALKDDKQRELTFKGVNYNSKINGLNDYDEIIIVDFSLRPSMMERYSDKITWIDHHLTAIVDSEQLGYDKITGLRNVDYSAAELTWDFYYPTTEMPKIINYIGCYDTFRHRLTNHEEIINTIQEGIKHEIKSVDNAYVWLNKNINDSNSIAVPLSLARKGSLLKQYNKNRLLKAIDKGNIVTFASTGKKRKVLLIDTDVNPQAYGIKYEEYDAVATFRIIKDFMVMVTLYSNKMDVSTIAKCYGGGGHVGAAGMILTNEEFNEIINN